MQNTLHHAGAIRLGEVLPNGQIFGANEIPVTSCCSDAKQCQPGDLFVAIVNADGDGHDGYTTAIGRGAKGILSERLLPVDVPVCVVDDTREAYGLVCQSLLGNPANSLNVIGVTGTSGKTVTAMLISSVLEAAGCRVGSTSTIGYCDGFDAVPAPRTTPSPPQLADWLARMLANGCDHAVIELSSQALAQRNIAGVELDIAALTNIRKDHLDLHGTVDNYRRAKQRMFDHLKPEGVAIINADDPTSETLLSSLDHPALTIGIRTPAEITATVIERYASEQTFLLTAGCDSIPVRTRMIGNHHIYNCLTAAAIGLVKGIDLTTIVRGLERVEYVPGRLERLECGQPFGVFVDCARTPESLATSLKTLRQVTDGRVICVFGSDADQPGEVRAQLGNVVERNAQLGIITSDNPRFEEPLQIAHDILDGYDRPARAHISPDRERAIQFALGEARPGDSVLVAGKGDQDVQVIGSKSIQFDDREVVRQWLYGVGAKIDYSSIHAPHLRIVRHTA